MYWTKQLRKNTHPRYPPYKKKTHWGNQRKTPNRKKTVSASNNATLPQANRNHGEGFDECHDRFWRMPPETSTLAVGRSPSQCRSWLTEIVRDRLQIMHTTVVSSNCSLLCLRQHKIAKDGNEGIEWFPCNEKTLMRWAATSEMGA